MKMVTKTPSENGSYCFHESTIKNLPDDSILWPDSLSTDTFHEYNGFVSLDVQEVDGVPTVAGCTPNIEAWEAWKASLPEEPEPIPAPPTAEQILDVLLGGGE